MTFAIGTPAATSTAIVPAAPPPSTEIAPASRRVQRQQSGRFFDVTTIAKHDPALANLLHAKLDFADVIEDGAKLTRSDAYEALRGTPEFARFDLISHAIAKADSATKTFAFSTSTTGILTLAGVAVALLGGGEAAGLIAGVTAFFGGAVTFATALVTADGSDRVYKALTEDLAPHLPKPAETPLLAAPADTVAHTEPEPTTPPVIS